MSGVSHAHTSVPRWELEPPALDTGGAGYLVLAEGADADALTIGWVRQIEALGRPVLSHRADPGWLADQLAGARIGVRVMAAGPELEMLDLIRTARAAGLLDAEMRVHVTDSARRRVHCTHCLTPTVATVAVGELLACAGCGRRLYVYHHVSRPLGAYMGFMADAEEPDDVAA